MIRANKLWIRNLKQTQHFIRISLDFLGFCHPFSSSYTQPNPNHLTPTRWVLPFHRPGGLISMLANFRRPTSSVFGLFTQPEVREVVYEAEGEVVYIWSPPRKKWVSLLLKSSRKKTNQRENKMILYVFMFVDCWCFLLVCSTGRQITDPAFCFDKNTAGTHRNRPFLSQLEPTMWNIFVELSGDPEAKEVGICS